MTMEVEGPDGSVVEFPDGTSHEVIKGAMAKHFGAPTPKPVLTPQQQTDAMSVPEKFGRGAAYGVLNGAEGVVSTLGKSVEGADPQKLAKLHSLVEAVKERMGVSPDQYAPASQTAQDPNATLGQRLANVPRSVVEMAGPAVVGGALGGLPGAVAATTATTAGPTIDRYREAHGMSPNQELTTADKLKVGGKLAADAAAITVGGAFTRGLMGPIEATGVKALTEAGKRGILATSADAALGAEATALDKVAIENKLPSVSDLTVGAAQGGLPGLVAHAPGVAGKLPSAVREPVVNRTFRPLETLNPESRGRVADVIDMYGSGSKGMNAAENTLNDNVTTASKGLDEVTKEKIGYIKNAIKEGVPVKQEWLDDVNKADPIAGQAVQDLTTFSSMRDLENSSLYKKVKDINPLTNFKSRITDYAIGHLFSPTIAKAIAAGETAIAGTAYGIDKFTGLSNPGKVITDKYAGTAQQAPSIAQARAAAKAEFIAQNIKERQAKVDEAQTELDKATALKDFQKFKTEQDRASAAEQRAKEQESKELWKTAITTLKSKRDTDAIRERYVRDRTDAYQDKTLSALDRLDQADTNAIKQRNKETEQAIKNSKYLLGIRSRSDIPVSEAMGRSLGESQNVPLPELVSSDARGSLKLNNAVQALSKDSQAVRDRAMARQASIMRNSQAVEQQRQNQLLANVGQQNRIRMASEQQPYAEMQSDPGVFRANQALARDRAQAAIEAEAAANAPPPRTYNPDNTVWGPSSDIAGTETARAIALAKRLAANNKKLEAEKAASERKANKQAEVKAQAKADRRVKEAEAKLNETKVEADPNTLVFEHRGQKIVKSKDDVGNPKAYREKFVRFTDKRLNLLDKAKGLTKSKEAHKLLDQLADDWTHSTNDPTQAQNHMMRISNKNEIPEVVRKYLKENWNSVEGTWATVNRNEE